MIVHKRKNIKNKGSDKACIGDLLNIGTTELKEIGTNERGYSRRVFPYPHLKKIYQSQRLLNIGTTELNEIETNERGYSRRVFPYPHFKQIYQSQKITKYLY